MLHIMDSTLCYLGEKKIAIAIFMILILSGFLCFFVRDEVPNQYELNNEELEQNSVDDEKPLYKTSKNSIDFNNPSFYEDRGTRSSSGNLSLQHVLGYGLMIGSLNSIKSADTDNDNVEEIIFGNEEGNIFVMERNGNNLVEEWISPLLGAKTYGLAVGDVDSDSTIEIVVGAADGIVRIFGWDGETYELEWESPDLGYNAFGLEIENVDNDEYHEIVVGTGEIGFYYDPYGDREAYTEFSPIDENLFVFGFNGLNFEQEWNTSIKTSNNLTGIYNIAIGDTDRDSINEIVIGTFEWGINNDQFWGKSSIYKFNGTNYSFVGNISEFNDWVIGLGIDDTDGDNDFEIVIAALEDAIYVYGYNDPLYSLEGQSIILSPYALVVGDTDNDGIAEIIESEGDTINIYELFGPSYSITWTSGNLGKPISGLGVGQTDGITPNEILIGADVSVLIYGKATFGYEEEAIIEGFGEIVSFATWDMDENNLIELYVLSKGGITQILEYDFGDDDFQLKGTIDLSGGVFTNIVIASFDDDNDMEICVVEGNSEISYSNGGLSRSWSGDSTLYFIEYVGGDYSIVDQVNIDNNAIFSVDVGDIDNDNRIEIAAGGSNGDFIIIGYVGSYYQIEDQIHISDDTLINCVGIGDTDNDGTLEIGLGDESHSSLINPSYVHIYGFDGNNYVEEWSTIFAEYEGPLALEIGTLNGNDFEKIFIKEEFSGPLSIYSWNGNSYYLEGQLNNYDMIFDEGLLIDEIITHAKPQLIIGSLSISIIEYDQGYSEIWTSEKYQTNPLSVEIADIDDSWSNELILAMKSRIFIYCTEWLPEAYLSVENDTYFVGEKIFFDGSNSFGDDPLEFYFDFGDGMNSGWINESITTHSYFASGSCTALLRVKDENNVVSTNRAEVNITIIEPNKAPTANINYIHPNPATEGEQVSFEGYGFDDDGSITAYHWESKIDGPLNTSEKFTSSFLSVGTHTIYFRVKDDQETWSESDKATLKIEAKPQNQAPIAYIDFIFPNPGVEGETITFEGHGGDNDGKVISYSWESNINGVLSDQSSFSTSSLSMGTHTISFKVKDDNEAWSQTATASLIIEPKPENQVPIAYIDSITPNPAIEGETISFSGYGFDIDGNIISFSWESDIDGILSTKRVFSTSDLSVGEHAISFKVKDNENVWSDAAIIRLVIKEFDKEEGLFGGTEASYNLLILIFLVAIAIIIIALITLITTRRTKDASINAIQISCPDCGFILNVTSSLRPLNVQCPNCGVKGVLNE